jgi:hypothetical protein
MASFTRVEGPSVGIYVMCNSEEWEECGGIRGVEVIKAQRFGVAY